MALRGGGTKKEKCGESWQGFLLLWEKEQNKGNLAWGGWPWHRQQLMRLDVANPGAEHLNKVMVKCDVGVLC